MLKKILTDKRYRKAFLGGFHYAVKHFAIIEDKHFFICPNSDNDHLVADQQHKMYRQGIKIARTYMLYRLELLTLSLLVGTALIFMFTW